MKDIQSGDLFLLPRPISTNVTAKLKSDFPAINRLILHPLQGTTTHRTLVENFIRVPFSRMNFDLDYPTLHYQRTQPRSADVKQVCFCLQFFFYQFFQLLLGNYGMVFLKNLLYRTKDVLIRRDMINHMIPNHLGYFKLFTVRWFL